MSRFFKKNKKKVVGIVAVTILLFTILYIIINIFDSVYYKIHIKSINNKGILYYMNSDFNNTHVLRKFMKYISNDDYENAFEMLDKNNKSSMFNDSVKSFSLKLRNFSNSYNRLEYMTASSRELDEYINEEIICSIVNDDDDKTIIHSIRFNVRTYKENKEPNIIIISIN